MTATERDWREDTDRNSNYFTHADITELTKGGTEITVRIVKAVAGKVKTRKSKRAVLLTFGGGIDKPLGLNPTNATAIEKLLGTEKYVRWVGKSVTLYISRTDRGRTEDDPEPGPGEKPGTINVKCVRVRPKLPGPDAAVYGESAPRALESVPADETPFDLEGWLARFVTCTTSSELTQARADLNATRRPKESRAPLAAAIEAADKRINGGAL